MTDDSDTDRDGYHAQRPVVIIDRPSGRIHARPDSERSASDELAAVVDARIRRKMGKLWGVAGAIVTALLGLAGGSVKIYGDNRALTERQALRIELLETEVRAMKAARDEEQREELRRLRAPWMAPQPKGPLP